MKNTNPTANPNRRRFLSRISLAFLWAFLIGRPAGTAAAGWRTHQRLRTELAGIISDRRAAERIGRLYLAAYPDENDPDRLAGELLNVGRGSGSKALRRRVAALRVRDFSRNDTVVIGGWVLTRIEARICALLCLL
jgi:hypothetical protein